MFGPHLTMCLYNCDKEVISDVTAISTILDCMPEALGMTKIAPPYCFKYKGTVPEDWGITGIVLIAESHISLHSFAEKGFVAIDIFSCKDFDVDSTVAALVATFKPSHYEKNLVMRGREFPRQESKVDEIVSRERESITLKDSYFQCRKGCYDS